MKVNKYDRQIRLWGHNGQKKLSEAKVALLGSSGAGVEALKNVVLPGVGHVDIWADGNVTQQDLATCFFYSPEDIGKPKASSLLANLLQMNPQDVQGVAYNQHPETLLKDTQKLKDYTLIICSNLKENLNKEISQQCYKFDIPVVFITVVGFYIYVRNQRITHIVESENSASKKYYMRLHEPFSGLREYSQQWNIEALVSQLAKSENQQQKSTIRHTLNGIPYPIILLQVYENLPQGSKTKAKVLQKIRQYSIVIGENDRQTFTEASNRTLDLFQTPDNFLPDISIFQNTQVLTATSSSPHSLQFLKACAHFYSQNKHLPQGTKLPDMHTSTKTYLSLKKIYKNQHQLDIALIQQYLHELFGECLLNREEISSFIENLQALGIIHLGQYKKQLENIDNPNLQWQAPEWRNILLALRAYKIFEQTEGRSPTPADLAQVKAISSSRKQQYGLEDSIDHRYSEQICRSEGKTMISINSIAGAVGGQQAIKLITNCFTPVKSGYIYSGVHSIGYSVSL